MTSRIHFFIYKLNAVGHFWDLDWVAIYIAEMAKSLEFIDQKRNPLVNLMSRIHISIYKLNAFGNFGGSRLERDLHRGNGQKR